jgi:hypothetical protein
MRFEGLAALGLIILGAAAPLALEKWQHSVSGVVALEKWRRSAVGAMFYPDATERREEQDPADPRSWRRLYSRSAVVTQVQVLRDLG